MIMENKLFEVCRSLFAGLDSNNRKMKLLSWDIKYLHPRTGWVRTRRWRFPTTDWKQSIVILDPNEMLVWQQVSSIPKYGVCAHAVLHCFGGEFRFPSFNRPTYFLGGYSLEFHWQRGSLGIIGPYKHTHTHTHHRLDLSNSSARALPPYPYVLDSSVLRGWMHLVLDLAGSVA